MEFTVSGLTTKVNVASWAALEARVSERLAQRRGFALATINLDHLVKLRRSAAFRRAYAAHDMVTADGNPITWLAALAGRRVALVPGADVIRPLSAVAARQGVTIALVGSTDAVLRAARSALERDIRDLRVVYTYAPSMGFDPDGEEATATLEAVRGSGARLCFLALGAPQQEILAARGRLAAPEVGFASIGAGLDFLAGSQRRAPRWVRRVAAEWLWRMTTDPRRLTIRYLRCFAILPLEAVKALRLRIAARQR